ncbi:LysE family translocator [Chromohalobacter sp. HP20-39]|uniref:LysE family translocator n=1 Tax=Chromohalobacter sp. HP20-39 TaxID=3079306 RepID=UPI00294B9427|nr:LysE family translocator [Chromohalobacter sp. HP20-39]MDV6317918.1 LysE family translocator [Chromohalobacter sp. HP20-39]
MTRIPLFCSGLLALINVAMTQAFPDAVTSIDWPLLIGASIVMALTPGANQLLSLSNGFHVGVAPAMTAACGRFAAFALMVVGVAVGLGHWLATSAVFFNVLKWIGVAYLSYLGVRSLLTAWRPTAVRPSESIETAQAWPLLRREALVALSNPKAYVLFALFLPQFLHTDGASFAPAIMLAGLAYILIEFACALLYAGAGHLLGRGSLSLSRQRWLDGISGSLMVSLAGWLALAKRQT